GDVSALDLESRQGTILQWERLVPSSVSPPNAPALLDPVRNRMLAFGTLEAVWSLPLAGAEQWSLLTTSGTPPAARDRYRASYDPIRERIVFFGGGSGGVYFNDTFALSLAGTPTWSQIFAGGTGVTPPGRYHPATAYDAAHDRLVVFGGDPGLSDTWTLSPVQ